MTAPNIRVNTFLKDDERPYIDPLSQVYIVLESVLGLNRLPAMLDKTRRLIVPPTTLYALILCISFLYLPHITSEYSFNLVMSYIEYIFCISFSFITWNRMERYYCELNKFDAEIGCRPKVTASSIKNLVLMFAFTTAMVLYMIGYRYYILGSYTNILLVPVNLVHCLEVYFYGHLLSLLTPRLQLINFYVESALSSGKLAVRPNINEFQSFKYLDGKNSEMKKLMDLYHIMIKAYDFLIEAIKWQLLVILIASFIITLSFCYHVSLSIIRTGNPFVDIVTDMAMTAIEMIPLFSPCMFGDRVHNEVRRLRELLASRLYENKLNKAGRNSARALLALTEARDLSFSLLRMLEIDISLPFKFVGLLVTYLIILLQFEKVINPTPT